MKNSFFYILILCIAAGMLASCSQGSESTGGAERAYLSKIYESAGSVTENQYDNLVMPEKVSLPKVDRLYTFCIKEVEADGDINSLKNQIYIEKLAGLIYSYSGIKADKRDITMDVYEPDDSLDVQDAYFCYSDKTSSLSYTYSPNGTFSISDASVADDVHGGRCIDYCLIGDGSDLGDMKGIEGFPAAEALEICQVRAADRLEGVVSEDLLNPYSLSLFKTPGGSYSYYIVYRKEYLGLELSESGEYLFADSGFIKPDYLSIQINSEKEIYRVSNMYSNVYDESSIKEIEDGGYVPLETALGLLSDYLAEYNEYQVENIDMVYFLPTRFEAGSSKLAYTRYIPGYEITLDLRLADEENSANLAPRITAYISMVSGDIYIFDAISRYQYFVLD